MFNTWYCEWKYLQNSFKNDPFRSQAPWTFPCIWFVSSLKSSRFTEFLSCRDEKVFACSLEGNRIPAGWMTGLKAPTRRWFAMKTLRRLSFQKPLSFCSANLSPGGNEISQPHSHSGSSSSVPRAGTFAPHPPPCTLHRLPLSWLSGQRRAWVGPLVGGGTYCSLPTSPSLSPEKKM